MPRPAKKLPRLTIEYGPQTGLVFPLVLARFVIGRSADCDLPIADKKISRQHAAIAREAERCFLADLGSRNGTFLNGQRLGPERRLLSHGDEIQLGALLVLRFEDPFSTAIDRASLTLSRGLSLDLVTREVYAHYRRVAPPLSDKLFDLLDLLMRHKGQVVSTDKIIRHIWPDAENVTNQMVDSLVARLRRKLLDTDPEHEYVVRERGRGLRFAQRE